MLTVCLFSYLALGSLPLTEYVYYVTTITSEPRIGHIGSWLVSICRLDRRDGFRNVFASLPALPIKNNGNRIRWSLLVLRLVFILNFSYDLFLKIEFVKDYGGLCFYMWQHEEKTIYVGSWELQFMELDYTRFQVLLSTNQRYETIKHLIH